MRETPDLVSSAESYANRFAGPVGEYLLSVQNDAIVELARPWAPGTVLDVGGGHAQLCAPLLESGFRVTILGSRTESLARARRLFGSRISYVTGELTDPPCADGSFDIVIAIRMLAHIRDVPALISGLCRVARHAVILDYPAAWSMNLAEPLLYSLKRRLEGDTRRYRLFRKREIVDLLGEHGFARTDAIPQFFWPMVLHRSLRRPAISRLLESLPRSVRLTRLLGSPVCLRAVRG